MCGEGGVDSITVEACPGYGELYALGKYIGLADRAEDLSPQRSVKIPEGPQSVLVLVGPTVVARHDRKQIRRYMLFDILCKRHAISAKPIPNGKWVDRARSATWAK